MCRDSGAELTLSSAEYRRFSRYARLIVVAAAGLGWVPVALAQPFGGDLLAEPDPFTDVLDAVDGDDPFDVRVGLGFRSRSESATIRREMQDDAGGRPRLVEVAASEHATKTLHLGVEVGIYRDLSLRFGLPFVLEDRRWLGAPESASEASEVPDTDGTGAPSLDEASSAEASAGALIPGRGIRSRLRDGIPYLEAGIGWSPVNQYRVPGWPTWTLRWDNRLGTSAIMEPCLDGDRCARGTSRGTWRMEWSSRWSYRYRLVEPLIGVSHAVEIPVSAQSRFESPSETGGGGEVTPPSVTMLSAGTAFIPWEDRGMHRRLRIAVLASGSYVSAGRDYSALFDALGTSSVAGLSVADAGSGGQATFSGLTRVAGHMRVGLAVELLLQAARQVQFKAGIGFRHVTAHWLTGEQHCETATGPAGCPPSGTVPGYRPAIDQPGRRFWQDAGLVVDLHAGAAGQF